jgi:hypothetical protein
MMIEQVWNRILKNEGEVFKQIRGKEFTFAITGHSISLNSTNRIVSKRTIEQALNYVPLENTVPLQHLQAPSYLFAILMDNRIRKNDW